MFSSQAFALYFELFLKETMDNSHGHLNIPMIFLTASKQPGLADTARQLGAAGYLEKPYEPEALLKMVGAAWETQKRPEGVNNMKCGLDLMDFCFLDRTFSQTPDSRISVDGVTNHGLP